MTSLLQWALTGAGGICIVLALKHVFVDYRASRDRIHLALGAAALAVAAYEYAALGVYRSTSIDGYVSAVRIHVAAAALAYLTLVWLSALQTRAVPRWLLWTATVTSAVIVVWNVLSPQTLLFAGVIEVQGVLLPWGEVIVQGVAIPSEWSHVGELLAFSLYGVCAYAWWGYSDDGESGTALPVATGMAVLLATMVVEAADPRVVPMLPADELGLFVLLLVLAFAGVRRGMSGTGH
jgi:hypothetical protein